MDPSQWTLFMFASGSHHTISIVNNLYFHLLRWQKKKKKIHATVYTTLQKRKKINPSAIVLETPMECYVYFTVTLSVK